MKLKENEFNSIYDIFKTSRYLGEGVWSCNCIGPQPGQTKCPCTLRVEQQIKIKEDTFDGEAKRIN